MWLYYITQWIQQHKHIVWYSPCRFFISQAIVISSVASHHSKCQHHFSSPVFHSFMSYHSTLLTNTVYSNQCHGVFTFSDSILHAQCHGYRWYSGGEGCDENIYYTITCSCVYPATAFGKFRRDCLLKSDMSFGDFASSCRGRLSIGNLQGHTPWVFDWVPSRASSSPTA